MRHEWYRQRKNKLLAGICSSLATQFSWNVWHVRAVFLLVSFLSYLGMAAVVLYVLVALLVPYKEDVYADRYGTGPRKRKDAEKIDKDWFSK